MSDRNLIAVKIIGWIELLLGGFGCLVLALCIFLTIYSMAPGGNPEMGLLFIPLASLSPLSVLLILGIGVLRLRRAARIANVIICSIVLTVALPLLVLLIFADNPDFLKFIPSVVMSGGILWFFTRPRVKGLFR